MDTEALPFLHNTTELTVTSDDVIAEITKLVSSPNYPCVPAILSLKEKQYMIGIYSDLGSGHHAHQLYKDLIRFKELQQDSKAPYLSFWAIFTDSNYRDENLFETDLWKELSALSSCEDESVPWDENFSSNPADPNFSISLGGDAYFVVGLHASSSRLARQFKWPALVFNLHEQFEELFRQGRYESTVKANRSREMKFQGELNPMVERHGDKWESIQFSGKNNPDSWKCPFQRSKNSP